MKTAGSGVKSEGQSFDEAFKALEVGSFVTMDAVEETGGHQWQRVAELGPNEIGIVPVNDYPYRIRWKERLRGKETIPGVMITLSKERFLHLVCAITQNGEPIKKPDGVAK